MAENTTKGSPRINKFYKVYIAGKINSLQPNQGIDVNIVAEMPEELNINIEQDWENPFKLVLNDKIQGMVQGLSQLAGRGDTLLWDHDQLYTYQGGSPLQLSFEIVFVANNSVKNDIVDPLKQLMKLNCPPTTTTKKVFEGIAGGASLTRLGRPPLCNIKIGNILDLSNVIITNVNPQITRPLVSGPQGDFQGAPMRIPVAITIQTTHIMTQNRIDEYFFKV